MLDEKKIAFITCVNDEAEYAECRYYLERLHVPDGYSMDIISIREAPSMTAGNNIGMKGSDAKYKVYLHQDVFIRNVDLISDMLKIFECDEQIGMLGLIGKREIGTSVFDMMKWDTGKVIYNKDIMSWERPGKGCYAEVVVADGFLLATQYDIPWREDVFDGWDFYDLSQCIEFKKAGYKVVVPYQEEIWCCHDGLYLEMIAYFDQYKRFLREYSPILGIAVSMSDEEASRAEEQKKYSKNVRRLKANITELFDIGERNGVRVVFQKPGLSDSPYLTEYDAIVRIDQTEEKVQESLRFWEDGMTSSQLILKLRILKYALKRIEYEADDREIFQVLDGYSRYAVIEACSRYVTYKERVYKKLRLGRGFWT